MHSPNDATLKQLDLIQEIGAALAHAGVDWWLFGGWAIDFHAGEITRDHADIEVFAWKEDIEVIRPALIAAGFSAPAGLYPQECQSFLKDGAEIGVWFIVRGNNGDIRTPGRWTDWPWARGAFEGAPLALRRVEARAMSAAGLLDMKQGFAAHPHGAPLPDKDVADIALLRRLISQGD